MARPIFEGSGVAVVTPFTSTGVDYAKLEKLVEFHIKNKSDAIIICGSTGEASTMPDEEHISVIKACVDAVAGRIPVIAGTGSNDTNHGIHLSQEAVKAGADALLVIISAHPRDFSDTIRLLPRTAMLLSFFIMFLRELTSISLPMFSTDLLISRIL